MKFKLACLLAVVAASPSSPAHAALEDFVCRDSGGVSHVQFYGYDGPGCAVPSTRAPSTGICQETVECAAISAGDRQRVAARYAQEHSLSAATAPAYAAVPAAERARLAQSTGLELTWREAIVTCPGRLGSDGSGLCPMPEACRADQRVQPHPARIDAAGAEEPSRETPAGPAAGATATSANPAEGKP